MNLTVHIEIVGAILLVLGVSHVFFNRFFGWDQDLADVPLFTRRVFFVHNFFIGLAVALIGAGSILYAGALLRPGILSRALLGSLTLFWFCRLFTQFFVYESAIWRGNRFRTFMHVVIAVLLCYITLTYGAALVAVSS